MPALPLDGKALALRIREELAGEIAKLRETTGIVPGLTVVLVGEDPASQVYVRNKQNAGKAAGIHGEVLRLPATTSQSALLETIDRLNAEPSVHGILVQLPLPRGIDDRAVIERIDPLKDVDGFHPVNTGLLAQGVPRFVPCTPLGIRELLIHAGVETRGAHAVVLGRSQTVGKPMAMLLLQKGKGGDATVTVCHTGTKDPAAYARQADILVVAMGQPESVRADWIKPGAVVIDVGIHKRADGTLCGDVDFSAVSQVASRITPVPGGVGPMTVAMLLHNTLQAARLGSQDDIRARITRKRTNMIRLGICNELFEGWEFGQVCKTVKAIGYEGLEIAPFTLAPRIGDLTPQRRRELRSCVEDAGLSTIGLHWLLAKTEGFYLTSPDAETRRRTGDYLIALAEATRDLGGSLMVFGSPKQRDLLPGVTYDQAVGYALEVFHRVMPAIGAMDVDFCLEPLAPTETNFLNTCAQAMALVEQVDHPHFKLHMDVKAQSGETGRIGARP